MAKERIAIYPGSFDPFTNGHLDIVKKAANVFDKVIVVFSINPNKKGRFPLEERIRVTKESLKEIPNAIVDSNDGFTVDYARKVGATFMVRGLRSSNDFEYEANLAEANRHLAPEIETVFFLADKRYNFVSSTLVDELGKQGKDISTLVPAPVLGLYKK